MTPVGSADYSTSGKGICFDGVDEQEFEVCSTRYWLATDGWILLGDGFVWFLIRRPHRGHQAVRFLPVGSPWSPSLLESVVPKSPPVRGWLPIAADAFRMP